MLYTNDEIKRRKNKELKIKKIISTIAYIILIPLLIYNTSLIIQAIIKPDKTPSFFGIKSYVIISGSMQPELEIGDIVIVKDSLEQLKEGDIISFRRDNLIITHRITEIMFLSDGSKQYKTKGDFNNVEDIEIVKDEQIEGKVVNTISNLGNILLFLKKSTTIILVLVIYYLYLLYCQSTDEKKLAREKKRMRYEKQKNKEKTNEK
ncbi:MAG: signal peptidase I [Clostridia bacterium]|nr:signal peptidase I [Clostridia bacterium]